MTMKLIESEDISDDESTEIGAPPKERQPRKRRSKLEMPVKIDTLNASLSGVFNGMALLSRSDARFEDAEFGESSKKVIDFINLFPPLRILIHILGPITVIADFVKKAQRIRDQRKPQEPRRTTITYTQPGATTPKQVI